MRTAAEIIKNHFDYTSDMFVECLVSAINEARIEAIKECAEVVEMKQGCDCDKSQIDLSLILELINQIK